MDSAWPRYTLEGEKRGEGGGGGFPVREGEGRDREKGGRRRKMSRSYISITLESVGGVGTTYSLKEKLYHLE